ncbi:MAG: hypothetical protein R3190_07455 [Thermoanaerobaculia bacterium]|nr:hypothetical protein [Thermoanaerobaculia bacterium]
MDIDKIDLKVFAAPAADGIGFEVGRLIPVFHRWIQQGRLEELAVDVADYSHVPGGPGVILVCHDAQYSVGGAGGGLGLLYSRRRETHPALAALDSLDERLESVFLRALDACTKLQIEGSLGGALRFPCDRFVLWINDRRVGTEAGDDLAAALFAIFGRLLPQTEVEVGTALDAGRLRADVSVAGQPGATVLAQKLRMGVTVQ